MTQLTYDKSMYLAAKAYYDWATDNDPNIHSNRFPSWGELSIESKDKYIQDNAFKIVAHSRENEVKTSVTEPESKQTYDPIMYIVVRRDLDMPPGKLAAQVGHAAVRCWNQFSHDTPFEKVDMMFDYMNPNKGNEAKIVLGCDDLEEIIKLSELARDQDWTYAIVTDAAHTVFNKPTTTCIGIGPISREDSKKLRYLGLY